MFVKGVKVFFPGAYSVRTAYGSSRIGNRDVVGHGHNGSAVYKDDAHFPFPAIRFGENTRQINALRLKEKGDWKMLSCEEKKALYRASFCQTFAEFQVNTGSWKAILGALFFTTSFSFWFMTYYHHFVQDDLPESLKLENQQAALRRILDMRTNPIDGISSLWNYDEDAWKRDVCCLVKEEAKLAKVDDDDPIPDRV